MVYKARLREKEVPVFLSLFIYAQLQKLAYFKLKIIFQVFKAMNSIQFMTFRKMSTPKLQFPVDTSPISFSVSTASS